MVAVVLLGGCSVIDDDWDRDRRGGRNRACNVDVDYWEHRVEQFRERDFRNEQNFRRAKQELLDNLRGLRTESCRRRVRREIDGLIEETRDAKG
jgi:hypothetical protein